MCSIIHIGILSAARQINIPRFPGVHQIIQLLPCQISGRIRIGAAVPVMVTGGRKQLHLELAEKHLQLFLGLLYRGMVGGDGIAAEYRKRKIQLPHNEIDDRRAVSGIFMPVCVCKIGKARKISPSFYRIQGEGNLILPVVRDLLC